MIDLRCPYCDYVLSTSTTWDGRTEIYCTNMHRCGAEWDNNGTATIESAYTKSQNY